MFQTIHMIKSATTTKKKSDSSNCNQIEKETSNPITNIKTESESLQSYQCRLLDAILRIIMLNHKQNQPGDREQPKKRPDPIREPPPNRAPVISRPPPHLSPIPSTIHHENKNPQRPIAQIGSRKHRNGRCPPLNLP